MTYEQFMLLCVIFIGISCVIMWWLGYKAFESWEPIGGRKI
jgi:hypothetical protein